MDEKPNAAQPKCRHRWYQFSLGVRIACIHHASFPGGLMGLIVAILHVRSVKSSS
jgi:hypothetical protein